ncbi:hypothetical protein NVP1244A_058 [Vibrio phage 1.244.A._10N.261.54.C3]|nr:hypothetical protein NVP1244A_058 [Vibrio phage 1.244.A._10N.261.54.C3]AUR98686.1 hypothetical protein NVP1255O_058 [Vibrio phage 1.255.O._10N.286.45.F1]
MIINAPDGVYTIFDEFDHLVTVTPETGETGVTVVITTSMALPSSVEIDEHSVSGWAGNDIFTDVKIPAEYILKGIETRQTPIPVQRLSDLPPPSEAILTAYHPSRMERIVYPFTVTVTYKKTTTQQGSGGAPGTSTTETVVDAETFSVTINNNWASGKTLVERYT